MPILPHPLADYPLVTALRDRRSRRFGLGMSLPGGPLAHTSRHPAAPVSEDDEAALVWAACGITGPALADLCYADGHGGNIMAGLIGRTVASGDALQTSALRSSVCGVGSVEYGEARSRPIAGASAKRPGVRQRRCRFPTPIPLTKAGIPTPNPQVHGTRAWRRRQDCFP